jgi:hypothetical protein
MSNAIIGKVQKAPLTFFLILACIGFGSFKLLSMNSLVQQPTKNYAPKIIAFKEGQTKAFMVQTEQLLKTAKELSIDNDLIAIGKKSLNNFNSIDLNLLSDEEITSLIAKHELEMADLTIALNIAKDKVTIESLKLNQSAKVVALESQRLQKIRNLENQIIVVKRTTNDQGQLQKLQDKISELDPDKN